MSIKTGYFLCGRFTGKTSAAITRQFSQVLELVNQRMAKRGLAPLRIFFGTEFSGMYPTLRDCCEVLIQAEEEWLKEGHKINFSWAIGYGQTDLKRHAPREYEITGSDFDDLRTLLLNNNHKKKRILPALNQREQALFLSHAFSLRDVFAGEWNLKRDQRILSIFLEGNDYKVAAEELDIARPQAWKKYKSMNMGPYFSSRELILEGADLLIKEPANEQIIALD